MTIDYQPGQEGFTLTPENKPAVQAWLKAEGIDPTRVDTMRDDTLAKAYRYPAYLKAMKTRADYYPPCSRKDDTPWPISKDATTLTPITKSGCNTTNAIITTMLPATIAPTTEPFPSSGTNTECGGSRPLGAGRRGTGTTATNAALNVDPATVLRELIGIGLTEARVIELIREHAPAIIAEILNGNRKT